eukprot:TRINITY_DN12971_c0_g1_i2.p1 TRINITY_DN12971_c0_g1~~TRINITY_DN12971_c0_g1_i2.p1  ORF type:complete len:232 (+),score=25.01 TRINITY_DN12971_c0_g1_i2:3-698(+)
MTVYQFTNELSAHVISEVLFLCAMLMHIYLLYERTRAVLSGQRLSIRPLNILISIVVTTGLISACASLWINYASQSELVPWIAAYSATQTFGFSAAVSDIYGTIVFMQYNRKQQESLLGQRALQPLAEKFQVITAFGIPICATGLMAVVSYIVLLILAKNFMATLWMVIAIIQAKIAASIVAVLWMVMRMKLDWVESRSRESLCANLVDPHNYTTASSRNTMPQSGSPEYK